MPHGRLDAAHVNAVHANRTCISVLRPNRLAPAAANIYGALIM